MKLAKTTAGSSVGQLLHQGTALLNAGDLPGAERCYLAVLKKSPRDPDALHLLGVLYGQRGDAKAGYVQIQKALAIRDDFSVAHSNAGMLAAQMGDFAAAERHLRRALQLKPGMAAALRNLAIVLREQGRITEALEVSREAVRLNPHDVHAHLELTLALRVTGDVAGQLASAEAGLQVAPGHPSLELAATEAWFARGDLKHGWHGYRRRFESPHNAIIPRSYAIPHWRGELLAGHSILIWTEQGLGDEVMYANMFAEVVAAAQRCVIQCSPRTAPLFRRSFPKAEIFDRDLTADEWRGIDFQSPAASLGEWLRADFRSFPQHTGYLSVDADLRDSLRKKYGPANLLVGIAWRSVAKAYGHDVQNAADKSINVLDWGPIFHVPGVTFVNLQYGDCAAELDLAAKSFKARIIQDAAVDGTRDVDAFAAQVAAMDLVISSSNTAAHFAGALGVPTLCMLPLSLGRGQRWYWFAQQGRCPWYPAMQLFLQRRDRQWFDVIRDVSLTLADRAAARGVAVAGYLRSVAGAFAALQTSSESDAAFRREDAEAFYRRLAQEPGLGAEAHFQIATLRKTAGDHRGVIAACDDALKADPAFWHAHNAKGSALSDLNLFNDAIATYRQGLVHQPDSPELHNNLATSLSSLGRESEAISHYKKALEVLPPEQSEALASIELSYAASLSCVGATDQATAILDSLVKRAPDNFNAHYNRSTIGLSLGAFDGSWPEFAWRLKRLESMVPPQFRADVKLNPQFENFPGTRWNGEDLKGKNVLVWTEQGLGDEILATTMIPDAIATAGHVTLMCSDRLVPLFRRSFPSATVEERKSPLPKSVTDRRIDFQMSISELGAAFRPSFAAFPSRAAFLQADPAHRARLRAAYEAIRPGAPVIGLAWSSLKNPEIGWLKGPAFAALAPILQTPGVTFVSLQYGDRRQELDWARAALGVEIVEDKSIDSMKDVDAFAAQVAAMDLVISTSNTCVHVAGGLGIPTWILVAEGRGRHWYWFRDRTDSPWYPGARLFRQRDNWPAAVEACAAALRDWCASQGKNAAK